MDHAEALELIAEAALEAGGLERLASGDTSVSAALVGHLVGCASCTAEFAAASRTATALRLVAEETPAADLRERTLALVGAVGRPRGGEEAAGADGAGAAGVIVGAGGQALRSLRRRFGVVAVAAAAAFALLAAGAFVAADLQRQLDMARGEVAELRTLGAEVQAMLQRPTTRVVALRGEGGDARGSLVADPVAGRLAVLVDALPPAGEGQEYRCWVEIDGVRRAVGRMWLEADFAYWSGEAEFAGWPPGARFGVSLEPVDEPASGPALLIGEL